MNVAALVCSGILLAMLGAVVGPLWAMWVLVRVFSALKKEAEKAPDGFASRPIGGGKCAFVRLSSYGRSYYGFASMKSDGEALKGFQG